MSVRKFNTALSAPAGTLEREPAGINFSADIDESLCWRPGQNHRLTSLPGNYLLPVVEKCPLIKSKENSYNASDLMVNKIPQRRALKVKIERTPHSQDDNEVMTVLNYSGRPIRMYYLDNMIWWVLTDICGLIGLGNPSKAADRLDDYEKMTRTISNSHSRQRGGAQKLILINESGLYHLLLTSRKPEVQSFRRWVTAEVIPSVRKNGGYIIGQETMEPDKLVTAAGQVTRNILTTRDILFTTNA